MKEISGKSIILKIESLRRLKNIYNSSQIT